MKKLTALFLTIALLLLALPTAALAADTIEYTVVTKTSDNYESGTDADVKFMVVGAEGRTDWHNLDTAANDHTRDAEDTFYFDDIDVGEIRYIMINLRTDDNWQCDWIDVNGIRFNLDGYWLACGDVIENFSGSWDSPEERLSYEIFAPGDQTDYDILVKTGDDDGAGTDIKVFISIFGSNGLVLERVLGHTMINDFEAHNLDGFSYKCADLGEIERVEVSVGGSSTPYNNWELSYVAINGQLFDANNYWFSSDETLVMYPSDKRLYDIRIDTEDAWWAGTDSDIYVKYVGDNGETDWALLDKSNNNDFERGDSDSYQTIGIDVGTVRYIVLENEGSDEWQIARVHFQGVTYHMYGHALEESEVEIPVDYSGASEVGSAVSSGSLIAIIGGGVLLIAAGVAVVVIVNKKRQAQA